MFFLLPFDSECAGEGVDAHRHGPIGSAFPAAIRAALAGGRLYARRRQNAPDQHLHRRVSGNKCLRTFLLVGIRACVERSPNSSGACIGQNEARRTAGRVWFRCCEQLPSPVGKELRVDCAAASGALARLSPGSLGAFGPVSGVVACLHSGRRVRAFAKPIRRNARCVPCGL